LTSVQWIDVLQRSELIPSGKAERSEPG